MPSKYPPLLLFRDEPDNAELSVILGPDFAAQGVTWTETLNELRIGPPRIPLRAVTIFCVIFFGLLTATPWVLQSLDFELPGHLTQSVVIGLTLATWLVILPTLIGILWFVDRMSARLGPGAILRRRERTLALPYADRVLDLKRVRCFVELSARRTYAGTNSPFVQYGALFEEAGGVGYASIAKLTRHGRKSGDSPLNRLAQECGLTVRRVRAGTIDS